MMKKFAMLVAVSVLSTVSFSAFAATPEEACKARAEKKHIAADKVDAFVTKCVEKHAKKKKAAKPAADAAATAPAK